jgi:DNA-dependent protein kinase catalytic subunit
LIGKLGGHNAKFVGEMNLTDQSTTGVGIAWDTVKRIKFSIPFQDIRPELFLDDFLPRIIELAEGARERATKVASCEALHAILLFMIGSSSQRQSNLVWCFFF